jgi:meso-butanediol dehydrogenase/(S,S)-butanediol dehydrogenase/diacetyl reductase
MNHANKVLGAVMTNRLQGKVAIITGGGQGIGAATAIRFAEEGAKVVICSRRIEPLQTVAKTIQDAGGECLPLSVDVSDELAVNNAVLMVPGMLANHKTKAWHQNFQVSLDGAMFLMRESFKQLRANGGAVVNVSSVCGLAGSMGTAGYSAAKAAMISLTRNASIEWAPKIRCNAVVPGAFLTPSLESVNPDEDSQKATGKTIPLQRIGDPRECANAILFLASDDASYITGAVLPVDGGRMAELNTGAAAWGD